MAFKAWPAFQWVRSDAPPELIRRCSRRLPRAAASPAIRPGRSVRAVKLVPMKRTFSGELPRRLVAMVSPLQRPNLITQPPNPAGSVERSRPECLSYLERMSQAPAPARSEHRGPQLGEHLADLAQQVVAVGPLER